MGSNKKADIEFDSVVVLIIAIIIIVVMGYFIYNGTILDWIANLPNPSYGDEDQFIDELPDDLEIKLNYYRVAVLKNGREINFCTAGDCGNLRPSVLIWDGDRYNAEIVIEGIVDDDEIGIVKNGRINIFDNLKIDSKSVISKEDLVNLDGGVYLSGIIFSKERKVLLAGEIDEEIPLRLDVARMFGDGTYSFRYDPTYTRWLWTHSSRENLRPLSVSTRSVEIESIKSNDPEAYQFIKSLEGKSIEGGVGMILDEIESKKGAGRNMIFNVYAGEDNKHRVFFPDDEGIGGSETIGDYDEFIKKLKIEEYGVLDSEGVENAE